MRNTRTILFDLDGTLIDTTDLILRCFEHAWTRVCGYTHARSDLIGTFGIPLREAMVRLLQAEPPAQTNGNGSRPPREIVDHLVNEYRDFNRRNHDLYAARFEGVDVVLHDLKERGYRIGVVTSKSRLLALRGLRLCGLDHLVESAVFLEDTDRHKPLPDPILAALVRMDSRVEHAAYVGDSPFDVTAARAAGVAAVAALWGPGSRESLERESPDALAERPHSLLEIFSGQFVIRD